MAPNNRPKGRKKKVGRGSASVSKRGSGLSSGSSRRPVGNSSGYKRTNRKPSSMNSSSSRPSNYSSSNSGRRPRSSGLSIKTIIIIGIILFVLYMVLKGGFGSGSDTGGFDDSDSVFSGNTTETTTNNTSNSSSSDTSAYAVDRDVSHLARDKRTVLSGDDTVTLMIYILGTDLESRSGMATTDIQEMLGATISEDVNIIIQTGGTKTWKNDVISSKTNQRYQITGEGMLTLENDLGKKSMVDPNTLSDFIRYSKSNFPADRYQLILWDHGGGSLTGFGYDEHFPKDHMTLDEVKVALEDGNTVFDFIGFDACLMGTLETAMVLEPFADYMIASEETEPGIGWYYTDWITELSRDPSIPTIDLGKKIIDDYVYMVSQKTPRSQATLSLIDLAELKGTVPIALTDFASSTNELIDREEYQTVSDARAGSKEFSKAHKLNQIDLIDFADKMDTSESRALASALRDVVKYNRTSTNIANANGVSIYFPYNSLNKLDSMLDTYDEIGMEDEYAKCVKSFASITAGGQVVSQGSGNMLGSLLGGGESSGSTGNSSGMVGQLMQGFLSSGNLGSILGGLTGGSSETTSDGAWLDTDAMEQSTSYYENNLFDTDALVITKKDGENVLALSEKQWDLVQYMELNVFIDDGDGYIDLGLDNVYEYNNDGDLIMDYDETWLTINGNIVAYYLVSDDHNGDNYTIKGRVPAYLNGQLVDIILTFDNNNPYGVVDGAQIKYNSSTETNAIAKGLIEIVSGDEIDFICDYYSYNGDFNNSYYLGNTFTATGYWEIENLSISQYDYQMAYRITDIYNNKYWTPTISE